MSPSSTGTDDGPDKLSLADRGVVICVYPVERESRLEFLPREASGAVSIEAPENRQRHFLLISAGDLRAIPRPAQPSS